MNQVQEFVAALNWVDYVIIIALLRGAYVGYRAGLFAELLRVFVYGATFLSAAQFGPLLAPYIEAHLSLEPDLTNAVGIVLAALASYLLLRFFVLVLLKVVKSGEGFVFNALGLVVGVLRWAVVLSILFMLIRHSGITALSQDIGEKSRFALPILPIAPTAYEYIRSFIPSLSSVRG